MVVENVILVDQNDHEIGLMEKMEAHRKGALHRAFSIFVFNNMGQLMMQQRAFAKYHSPGLWTNTCCSHPRKNETLEEAAHRRLKEEMGFDSDIKKVFDFTYHADVGQGLTEHEFDHVFIGHFEGDPRINKNEVADWKWMSIDEISNDLKNNPEKYTVWFRIAFYEVVQYLNSQN
ncbi:isopentenyl-diphosphate Delta-isomerase [candidate division KSB1 bacterium]